MRLARPLLPALCSPPRQPVRDAKPDVHAACRNAHTGRRPKSLQPFDHCQQFHAVLGRTAACTVRLAAAAHAPADSVEDVGPAADPVVGKQAPATDSSYSGGAGGGEPTGSPRLRPIEKTRWRSAEPSRCTSPCSFWTASLTCSQRICACSHRSRRSRSCGSSSKE